VAEKDILKAEVTSLQELILRQNQLLDENKQHQTIMNNLFTTTKDGTPPVQTTLSYKQIQTIVFDARDRQRRTGESDLMLACWLSEGLNAALTNKEPLDPKDAERSVSDLNEELRAYEKAMDHNYDHTRKVTAELHEATHNAELWEEKHWQAMHRIVELEHRIDVLLSRQTRQEKEYNEWKFENVSLDRPTTKDKPSTDCSGSCSACGPGQSTTTQEGA
jgi:hypothetical protein